MSEIKNVIIIGSGPAGYTAGIYAGRANLQPLMFAGEKAGGQLMWTTVVENFPGFKDGKNGPDLMVEMMEQAMRFGTDIRYQNVNRVDLSSPDVKKVYVTEKGEEVEYQAKAIIITTGAESIMTGIPGEGKLLGRGVATCAVCDAAFYKEKTAVVIGGGDSAMEDTLALTKFATKVIVIHRRDQFKASKIMQERVLNNPKVEVMWNSVVKEVVGETKLEKIIVTQDGQDKEVVTDGMFLAIGHKPTTEFLGGQVEVDGHGYILTRQSVSKRGVELAQAALNEEGLVRFPTMTTVEGVFAAGDVVDVRYKQAITASAQGCQAAIDVERWLEAR